MWRLSEQWCTLEEEQNCINIGLSVTTEWTRSDVAH